jgi:WD40 repeat protein
LEQQTFHFWEIKTQQVRARIEAKYGSMRIAADGKSMNVVHVELGEGVNTYKIERWRFVDDPRVVELMRALTVSATSVPNESPDLDRIVTLTGIPGSLNAEEIKLWDFATGEEMARGVLMNGKIELEYLRFSREGRLLSCHSNNRSQLDRQDRQIVWQLEAELKQILAGGNDPDVSPNGRWLLVWIKNGALLEETVPGGKQGELRNASDESPTFVVRLGNLHWARWTKGTFSPDSKTVVITGLGHNAKDGPMTPWLSKLGMAQRSYAYFDVARLWDVERCKELACFDDCDQVLYSPDSKTLATCHNAGAIRLWNVPPRKPLLAIFVVSLVIWLTVLVGMQLWTRLIRRFGRRRSAATS